MPFNGPLRQLKDRIGRISRRNVFHYKRFRAETVELDRSHNLSDNLQRRSCWANVPPEILQEVLHRLNSSENSWPARKHVVACAAVCRKWRDIIKGLVKTPDECQKLTFPVSLKQSPITFDNLIFVFTKPGPRDSFVQCFIRRDRATSTYRLYLGLTPTLLAEKGKFLLAARKFRRVTETDYVISLNPHDISKGSNAYLGKLRSNFWGTKSTVYDSQPQHYGPLAQRSRSGRRHSLKQILPMDPSVKYNNVADVTYELNFLGTRGPRRMHCTLHAIPSSATEIGTNALASTEMPAFDDDTSSVLLAKSTREMSDFVIPEAEKVSVGPLILQNKCPRWHEQLQCWCLNFRGRVTVASVKKFQLFAPIQRGQPMPQIEDDKVLLQFGKIGTDIFTMDYRYPLSAFQAFAICLSSFDTKLACE